MADFDPASVDDLRTAREHADDELEPEGDPPSLREGLPPRFRMRADRHYVDLLASQASPRRDRSLPVHAFETPAVTDVPSLVPLIDSIRQHGVLQPLLVQEHDGDTRVIDGRRRLAAAIAAGLRDVPCLIHAVDDTAAATLRHEANATRPTAPPAAAPAAPVPRTDADLARGLSSASGLADLLAQPLTGLSQGAIVMLLRTELWRAAHLQACTTTVLGDELALVQTAVSVSGLVDRVAKAFEPERRLRHIDWSVHSELPAGQVVVADEARLELAITSAVMATMALLEALPVCRLSLSLGVTASRAITVAVQQDHVRPASAWLERAFDVSWTDRPGGLPAAVAMAAVRRVARAHGGDATAVATARGTRVAITLPPGA